MSAFLLRLYVVLAMRFRELDRLSKRFAVCLLLAIAFFLSLIAFTLGYFFTTGDYSANGIIKVVLTLASCVLGVIAILWVGLVLVQWKPDTKKDGFVALPEEERQP
jgi:cytochrome c biogenesis factor